jgi:hypothetical protein
MLEVLYIVVPRRWTTTRLFNALRLWPVVWPLCKEMSVAKRATLPYLALNRRLRRRRVVKAPIVQQVPGPQAQVRPVNGAWSSFSANPINSVRLTVSLAVMGCS